nr:leucine--tRNA ligase [Pseudopedobacter sp.]
WSMRISAYAERLLQGLNDIDWPEPLKEMQRNWIGKSVGAMMRFGLIPNPSPKEKGAQENENSQVRFYETANVAHYALLKANSKANRKNQTDAEVILWNSMRDSQTGFKIRRQHVIEGYITDFVCLPKRLVIEVDGAYHNDADAMEYDKQRTQFLNEAGFEVIRFTNEQAINNTEEVIANIKEKLQNITTTQVAASPLEKAGDEACIEVFTTRVDTAYGVSFLVIAPEHELVTSLTTAEQKGDIDTYILATKKKSELDRMSDVKTVSGAFTGSYAINPLNGAKVPVWIADYVLAGYGTGAVMAVPSGDQRDYLFAKHFNLPVIPILDAQKIDKEADPTKEGKYINSGIINGMGYKEATTTIIAELKKLGMGYGKINYRMRDAIFGRQRYWGEPVPVYFKNGLPYLIAEEELPLLLPEVDKYLPTESGEPPLGRAKDWKYKNSLSFGEGRGEAYEYELSTMPGWAGSSWYWYRYMDAKNDAAFADKDKIAYWKDVDLYIGGSEHATGHLLYSRFWNKFLKDLGYVTEEEPFKKLINQGMIQGRSNFVYRLVDEEGKPQNTFISNGLKSEYKTNALHVDVNIVENDILDVEKFKASREEYANAEFILESGKYICGTEIEKMSKSKFNVVNPDDLVERYGADTLRMHEMFLGPLEQSKPWNTNGIEGVFKFLRKFWKLFHNENFNFSVSDAEPKKSELKSLHKIIKKVEDDVERFSFNTSVSSFMIVVNELTDLKSNNKSILQDLVVILSPYAPHICEELWVLLGNEAGTLSYASFPKFVPEYLVENEFAYPVSINGKTKTNFLLSLSLEPAEIEKEVMNNDQILKYLDGKTPKKVIVVKGRIINIVV